LALRHARIKMVSSQVIKGVDWQEMSILLPHEGYRLMIVPMPRFKINTEEKANMFDKWWTTLFIPIISEHHDIEEELYFPWINAKVELPDKLAASHKDLHAQMDEISKISSAACKGNVAIEGPKLEKLLATFTTFMLEHLQEEEEHVPAALRTSSYTEEDDKAMLGKILEKVGKDMPIIAPLFFFACEQPGGVGPIPNGQAWASGLPPPVQEVLPKWNEIYLKENDAIMKALAKTGLCCTVA